MNTRILGVDPAPDRCYAVTVEFDPGGRLVGAYAEPSEPGFLPTSPFGDAQRTWVAIEDPTGVLFSKTNSVLWSKTCRTAGEVYGLNRSVAAYVAPQDARQLLGRMAKQSQPPTKDREVRECLLLVYGEDAFEKEKLCPRRKLKKHDLELDCALCHGTGVAVKAGILSELTSPHLRDAFVVAVYYHSRVRGG
jgi:hypothetical protein